MKFRDGCFEDIQQIFCGEEECGEGAWKHLEIQDVRASGGRRSLVSEAFSKDARGLSVGHVTVKIHRASGAREWLARPAKTIGGGRGRPGARGCYDWRTAFECLGTFCRHGDVRSS